ncbi:unnamed protein product [Aphanomyces euteiches]|uniref:Mediator of RNA polymerase II transcription subunit 14 n=1 Tax=Aphanomyces euteiches TaxID=100861 RepID=A0A6G0WC97_9STRA|nr:hypothetical protein Ae201684_017278 [Aphanomyces euteiches]KAH9081093.1 hypothetical protein Ae201684P_012066 [Aphanomyces euteiches]KAH9144939.1 hypothetical protein AeRB84_011112 [Aphanomyces euteiches]
MDLSAQVQTEPVELRDLVSRCVNRSYDSIRTLTMTLPNAPKTEERRAQTLEKLVDARNVFEKLLAVTRWSVQSPIAEQCTELLKHATVYQDQLDETSDRLSYLQADLNRAKERQYDLQTAIDVLFRGSYSKLPRVIHHALHPRELPPVDPDKSSQDLDDMIRFRLIEQDIPEPFGDIDIQGGFASTHVDGQFNVVFTVNGNEPDSLWRIIDVSTVLSDPVARKTTHTNTCVTNLRIISANTPTSEHYRHLKNLVQKRCNETQRPLQSALDIMSDFCRKLALHILLAQGHVLATRRWPHTNFEPSENALTIMYWDDLSKITKEEAPPSRRGLCIQLRAESSSSDLFSVHLDPLPPRELYNLYPELLRALKTPSNLYDLNVEQFLLGGMHVHAASALFCLERKLVLGASTPLHLMTGEAVSLVRSTRSFRIARLDSTGQSPLEISFEMRTGRFAVFCLAVAKSPLVARAVSSMESTLLSQVKVVASSGLFALSFEDENVVHTALAFVLREIVAFELSCFAASCANVEVQRNVQINWDRYINFRQQTGNSIESLSLSPHALFFQIVRNKESSGYLVVEFDRLADMESDVQNEEEWVRSPAFSLLQLQTSSIPCAVQFFQRFPAFRKDSLPFEPPPSSKKRRLDGTLPMIASLFLHVISLCHERIQLQHYVNFARRRVVKIKYAGQGGTSTNGVTTGEQIVSFPFPNRVSVAPLVIRAVHGHLRKRGGFEMCVQLSTLPFDFILPKKQSNYNITHHSATAQGNLIFRYPPIQKFQPDNPLETFMADLIMHVKPMAEFGVKLQRTLSAVGRYTSSDDIRDHFFVERADPFGFVLACRTANPKRCVAAGSTVDNLVTYRITIEYNPKSKFVLSSSHKAEHPLLHFIEAAFNIHTDSAQLLEALERTTIPLGILSSTVCSQLISAKCYRQDQAPEKPNGVMGGGGIGKKGGKGSKGIRIAYKAKLPGEEKGYYAEKSYGGDDKSFVPAELLLIPRSQNHIRLTYADRCGIDIFFLENEMVNIRSAPSGVRVPSCSGDGGITVSHEAFGERLKGVIFPEMASL